MTENYLKRTLPRFVFLIELYPLNKIDSESSMNVNTDEIRSILIKAEYARNKNFSEYRILFRI